MSASKTARHHRMKARNPSLSDPVVSCLPKLPHPYSSIALSPDRHYAVTACKDTLQMIQVDQTGANIIKTFPIAHHFRNDPDRGKLYERGDSGLTPFGQKPAAGVNVVITDVAWSLPQVAEDNKFFSLVAAAGSNGIIVVWNADNLMEKGSTVPEAVLRQHSRAVNRLDWHPTLPGLLLSASQDGKVLLWERSKAPEPVAPKQQARFNRFFAAAPPVVRRPFVWQCRTTFEPKSEAVRDIKWSPFFEDVFALVTSSGSLIAYNMSLRWKALVKVTAHTDATTLDWHPKLRGVIATGGAGDRCVKIWNIERKIAMDSSDEACVVGNQNTLTSRADSVATDSSTENESSPGTSLHGYVQQSTRTVSSHSNPLSTSRHRGVSQNVLHVLSISAAVTRIRWRPCADIFEPHDRHESMIAVATAPVKGASAGGAGLLALWSWKRPFMPLSVVMGHQEGAVTDFHWLDTPRNEQIPRKGSHNELSASHRSAGDASLESSRRGGRRLGDTNANSGSNPNIHSSTHSSPFRNRSSHGSEADAFAHDSNEHTETDAGFWQHVLSVGRDGRCLIQSLARGDRPITRVPPSCFAMANLSPFQTGCGSLQLFSVCQPIPSGPRNEFLLTGLRRDALTVKAPGIFREDPVPDEHGAESVSANQWNGMLPKSDPELHFNVIDQGTLDEDSQPSKTGSAITVAPEVVHFSRFANRYKYYLSDEFPSRVELCMHNAFVAETLQFEHLAEMWKMVAVVLENSGTDSLPDKDSDVENVMQFVLVPTLRAILEERADAGDLQTCVALCEVLQVVTAAETVKIDGLELEIVREWYLAYIDILRDMCLFSEATSLIRNCSDPYIAALNKQSTTIHESCPQCGKALMSTDGIEAAGQANIARRLCKSCRRRIGFCFLCHQPVKGMYVWCAGCGHGGHLEHALQWFGGGSNGKPVREVCPTGCGHRCNSMLQQLSAFPRTESMLVRERSSSTDLTDLVETVEK